MYWLTNRIYIYECMYVQNKYVFRLNCMPMYESVSNKAITLYVTRWATAKTWNSLRFSLLKTKNRHNNVIKTHIKQFRCLIFESPSTDTYTPFIFSGWILHHLSIDFRCVFFFVHSSFNHIAWNDKNRNATVNWYGRSYDRWFGNVFGERRIGMSSK